MIKNKHLVKKIEKLFDRDFYISCYADYLAKMGERLNSIYEYVDYLVLNIDEESLNTNGYNVCLQSAIRSCEQEFWNGEKPVWAGEAIIEVSPDKYTKAYVLTAALFYAKAWNIYGDVGHESYERLMQTFFFDADGTYIGQDTFDPDETLSNLKASYQTSTVYAATIRTLKNLRGVVDKTYSNIKTKIVDAYKSVIGSFSAEPDDYIIDTFANIATVSVDAGQLIDYVNSQNNPEKDSWVNSYDNDFYNMTGATYSAICTLSGLAIDAASLGVKVTFGVLYSIGYAIGKGLLNLTYKLVNWVEQLGRTVEIKVNSDEERELVFDSYTMLDEIHFANRKTNYVDEDMPAFWTTDDGLISIKTIFGIIQFKTTDIVDSLGNLSNPVAYKPRYCNIFVIQDWMISNGLDVNSTSIQEVNFTDELIDSLVTLMTSPSAADVTFPNLDSSVSDLRREEYIAAGFVLPQVLISEILGYIYLNTIDDAAVEGVTPKFKVIPYGHMAGSLRYGDNYVVGSNFTRSNPTNRDWVRIAAGANETLNYAGMIWYGLGLAQGVSIQAQYPFFNGGTMEWQFAPYACVIRMVNLMCALKKVKEYDDIGGGFVPYSKTMTSFPPGAFSIMSDSEVATSQISRQLLTWAAVLAAVGYGVVRPFVKKLRLKRELAYRTRIEEINAKIRNGTATTNDLKFAKRQAAKLNQLNNGGLAGNVATVATVNEPVPTNEVDLGPVQEGITEIKNMINSH